LDQSGTTFASTDENAEVSIASLQERIARLESECQGLKTSERRFRSLIAHASDVITVMNRKGEIKYCSTAWERVLDYSLPEIVGSNMREFLHPDDGPRVLRSIGMFLKTPGAIIHREFRIRRKDSRWRHMEGSLTNLLHDPDVHGIVLNAHDITERVRMEMFFRSTLKEKETLIKEIHHRVKNNLQLISSMLGLQAHHIRDDEVSKIFRDSKDRIKSMALIHEKLYQSKNLTDIDVAEYLSTLIGYLISSHGVQQHSIRFTQSVGEFRLEIDIMIHLGLLVNEIVTNSVKHAFPGGREGEIRIEASEGGLPGTITVRISDTGVGLPKGTDLGNAQTLGLQLIVMLTSQLNGTIALDAGSEGTAFIITIPLTKH
jgi:PAS domain S-box-containing protein